MSLSARRAWIEMSIMFVNLRVLESLSARRAWIEIPGHEYNIVHNRVALRKESVDRNFLGRRKRNLILMSLSARRAWIEIFV